MARLPHIVHKRKKSKIMGSPDTISRQDIAAMQVDARLDLIRALIPIGLSYVAAELEQEVVRLAGVRNSCKADQDAPRRHGTNPGSVKLAGQSIPIRVPRLRDPDGEVPLVCYENLHRGGDLNDQVFRQVLYGISCRNYEQAAAQIPGAIGLSSSTVSRKFVEASAKKLREFQERGLSSLDLVAVFLDGKSFAEDQMVIAAGVDLQGHKHILGFVQTSTENKRSISQFLKSLTSRGLDVSDGLLAVIDGAKGLRAALFDAFPDQVVIQRCQWHKRENVVSYLARCDQKYWRDRLQKAYQRPTYDEAKRELKKIRRELVNINESAVASLDEGFEETLTLHRLGLFGVLGRSLKTTNISAGAATINVPGDYVSIGLAIGAAIDGDIIQVESGVYSGPDNRNLEINGINLSLMAISGPSTTIIDCEGLGLGISVLNGAGPSVLIEGFTIRNATGGNGSALVVHQSMASISGCIFETNTVSMNAGAVWIGYATGTVTVDACEFYGNTSVYRAGALMIDNSTAEITNCIFADNVAGSTGGGAMYFNTSQPTVHACILTRNDGGGGAGGIASASSGAFQVTNTIIANSLAGAAANSGTYTHCIAWNNAGGDDLYDSVNNLVADPLFCDPSGDSFFVCADSPAAAAAAANPWGETVGFLDQGCPDCGDVAQEDLSWSGVKALYR